MKNEYYNNWKSEKIYKLIKKDPTTALALYEQYLLEYPKDYYAYLLYTKCLLTLDRLDDADKVLYFVWNKYIKDEDFSKQPDKVKAFEKHIFFTKLRLLSHQERYEEMYKFYYDNINMFSDIDLVSPMFYCKKQLGKINIPREDTTYIFRQMIEYDENDFIKHAKRHTSENNQYSENPNDAIFVYGFPLEKVIDEIKKLVPSEKKLRSDYFVNKYVFKYDRCGTVANRMQDFFVAACFNNSDKFITMYPSTECKSLPYVDLNYLKENKKTKVKSQIEKFNQRYRRRPNE